MINKDFTKFFFIGLMGVCALSSCSDDDAVAQQDQLPTDGGNVGEANDVFSKEEWFPGGELGTGSNEEGCYENQSPEIDSKGLYQIFMRGEESFDKPFISADYGVRKGLGPSFTRDCCKECHPSYGHGWRQDKYNGTAYGNGYLLVVFQPDANRNENGNPVADNAKDTYVGQLTGMPQTRANSPFLPPIDENGINIKWEHVTSMPSGLAMQFPDNGEKFDLIYPEVTIDRSAINVKDMPANYEVRLESTIGVYGTALLDAISEDDMKAQYQKEAEHINLNPLMWNKDANDWASTAWYQLAEGIDGQSPKRIKKFTYAMTRTSLQDGPGANAIWNITNVTRSDRPKLYTTQAWADQMAEEPTVISTIQKEGANPNSYLHAFYGDGSSDSIAACVRNLLSPNTNQFDNPWHNFSAEMSDYDYYAFLVWQRGLAVPQARNLNTAAVKRGKQLFTEMGCVNCHRPSWKTASTDNYWAPANVKQYIDKYGFPTYPGQTIYPYTDLVQHRLDMKNDLRTGWCRTTPLWGRGLSKQETGHEDRLHDCRARNEVEAIMWHAYSKNSQAFYAAEKFYHLKKADRDAVVAFLRAI